MGLKWFWGIVILAIISLLLTLFGPWNALKHSRMMGTAVSEALTTEGLDFASVDMSGNVATLTGTAPSDAEAARAVGIAKGAKCEDCKDKKNTWHEVKNNLDVVALPVVSPFIFKATKSADGSVLIDGYVNSEEERVAVLERANALYPNKVTDNKVTVANGAPNPAWTGVVLNSLGELNVLEQGRFEMEDQQFVMTGLAADETARNQVNTWAAGLPEGYVGSANISVPQTAAVNVGVIKSESVCQTRFQEIKGDNKINFAYDKAQILGAESFDLLIQLAATAEQCEDFRIQVAGHTDSDGVAEYNQWLSEARANEVVKFLVDNGVDVSRMTAIGYGEANPIADNNSRAGMARNRRIEFTVTRSE